MYLSFPFDLIPDFIPVVGYLDDLVLVPLGVLAVRAMVPPAVLAECREQAVRMEAGPPNWIAASVIVALWVVAAAVFLYWLLR